MGNHPLTSKTPIQITNPNRAGSNPGCADHLLAAGAAGQRRDKRVINRFLLARSSRARSCSPSASRLSGSESDVCMCAGEACGMSTEVCLFLSLFLCRCLFLSVSVCLSLCVFVSLCLCVSVFLCFFVFVSLCLCVCVFVFVFVCRVFVSLYLCSCLCVCFCFVFIFICVFLFFLLFVYWDMKSEYFLVVNFLDIYVV